MIQPPTFKMVSITQVNCHLTGSVKVLTLLFILSIKIALFCKSKKDIGWFKYCEKILPLKLIHKPLPINEKLVHLADLASTTIGPNIKQSLHQ